MFDTKFEQNIFIRGFNNLGALDEAGRGPLAGPVVACCVVLSSQAKVPDELLGTVNDSKKLSPKKREQIFDKLMLAFTAVGIGICDHETIDRINILEASFLAMKKAIGDAKAKPDYIILDGQHALPNSSLPQQAIIRGDSLVFSIAAASIIAKVTRDRIMEEMHDKYPAYEFNRHKGYGTKLHKERLQEHGPCAIHRQSFRPVRECVAR